MAAVASTGTVVIAGMEEKGVGLGFGGSHHTQERKKREDVSALEQAARERFAQKKEREKERLAQIGRRVERAATASGDMTDAAVDAVNRTIEIIHPLQQTILKEIAALIQSVIKLELDEDLEKKFKFLNLLRELFDKFVKQGLLNYKVRVTIGMLGTPEWDTLSKSKYREKCLEIFKKDVGGDYKTSECQNAIEGYLSKLAHECPQDFSQFWLRCDDPFLGRMTRSFQDIALFSEQIELVDDAFRENAAKVGQYLESVCGQICNILKKVAEKSNISILHPKESKSSEKSKEITFDKESIKYIQEKFVPKFSHNPEIDVNTVERQLSAEIDALNTQWAVPSHHINLVLWDSYARREDPEFHDLSLESTVSGDVIAAIYVPKTRLRCKFYSEGFAAFLSRVPLLQALISRTAVELVKSIMRVENSESYPHFLSWAVYVELGMAVLSTVASQFAISNPDRDMAFKRMRAIPDSAVVGRCVFDTAMLYMLELHSDEETITDAQFQAIKWGSLSLAALYLLWNSTPYQRKENCCQRETRSHHAIRLIDTFLNACLYSGIFIVFATNMYSIAKDHEVPSNLSYYLLLMIPGLACSVFQQYSPYKERTRLIMDLLMSGVCAMELINRMLTIDPAKDPQLAWEQSCDPQYANVSRVAAAGCLALYSARCVVTQRVRFENIFCREEDTQLKAVLARRVVPTATDDLRRQLLDEQEVVKIQRALSKPKPSEPSVQDTVDRAQVLLFSGKINAPDREKLASFVDSTTHKPGCWEKVRACARWLCGGSS